MVKLIANERTKINFMNIGDNIDNHPLLKSLDCFNKNYYDLPKKVIGDSDRF